MTAPHGQKPRPAAPVMVIKVTELPGPGPSDEHHGRDAIRNDGTFDGTFPRHNPKI